MGKEEGTVGGRSTNWDVQETPAWPVVGPWGEERTLCRALWQPQPER